MIELYKSVTIILSSLSYENAQSLINGLCLKHPSELQICQEI